MPQATQTKKNAYQRLPEGMTRISYNEQTGEHIFKDVNGSIYHHSEPGKKGGPLAPVGIKSALKPESAKPRAPPAHSREEPSKARAPVNYAPQTFQDILPPEYITNSTLSANDYYKRSSSKQKEQKARGEGSGKSEDALGRSSTMKGVLGNIRRSVTKTLKKPPHVASKP